MNGARRSLSGAWSGAYRYPGDVAPETVFNAVIEETGGAFSGHTQEPNILGAGAERVVTASIEGARTGARVSFVKFMDGSGGMRHTVRYEGEANAALTHVEGRWIIRGQWSGTFFMDRDEVEAEASIARAAAIELTR